MGRAAAHRRGGWIVTVSYLQRILARLPGCWRMHPAELARLTGQKRQEVFVGERVDEAAGADFAYDIRLQRDGEARVALAER